MVLEYGSKVQIAREAGNATSSASVRDADKSRPYIPRAGVATDGWSKEDEATATCFCGAVQLAFVSVLLQRSILSLLICLPDLLFSDSLRHGPCRNKSTYTAQPTAAPGLVDSFVCNCTDCRKLTASMFTSAFIVNDTYLKHLRGQANLKTFAQNASIASGTMMTNFFCDTCGTLMYRVAERLPGHSLLRLGTVDDFNLAETKLKPRTEVFTKDRVSWFAGVPGEDVYSFEGSPA